MFERINQLENELELLKKENNQLKRKNNFVNRYYNHTLDQQRWFENTAEYFKEIFEAE